MKNKNIKKLLKFLGKKFFSFRSFLRKKNICFTHNARQLLKLKDAYKNKRCFLIGNGSSLRIEDLEMLKNECCFACNMIYKVYNQTEWRPQFHFLSDPIYSSYLKDDISECIDSQFITNRDCYYRMRESLGEKLRDIIYVENISEDIYRVNDDMLAYYVPSQGTVMTLMIEMAVYMGFSEIYLLGVDCNSTYDGKNYFIEKYKDEDLLNKEITRFKRVLKKETLTGEELYDLFNQNSVYAYKVLNEYANSKNVKICNATRGGNLNEFPRIELKEALKIK